MAVFDPFKYANSSGKQLVNSFYAVSNGGLFGRGLGESIQKRGYLPEPYTDFILSVIAEELGVLGSDRCAVFIGLDHFEDLYDRHSLKEHLCDVFLLWRRDLFCC